MLKLQLVGVDSELGIRKGLALSPHQMTDFFAFFYSVISQECLAAPHKKSY